MTSAGDRQERYYAGIPMIRYDLLKELALALVGSLILIVVLGGVLSSPNIPSVTIQTWAQNDPVDFVTTAVSELSGTSTSAGYGPPYNNSGSAQAIGPIAPAEWFGVRIPVDSAQDFVLHPLSLATAGNPSLATALSAYNAASPDQQSSWLAAYTNALANPTVQDGHVVVAAGSYGPVPNLMDNLLAIARTGGLDGLLLQTDRFYQTDFTSPLLFMGDGTYFSGLADQQHLTGDQWGMMNETGSYPGQTWLWLYTFWYQIPPFSTADNADLVVVLLMIVLTAILALIPFIPGLRDIPRWVPVYRLIWRGYYHDRGITGTTPDAVRGPPGS